MSVEIVKRMTARLKHNANVAAKISEVKDSILPQMENDVRQIANATSGQEKAIEIAEQAIAELKQLSEIIGDSNATIGAGMYHAKEAFDDAEQLSADLLDDSTMMQMFPIWFQANPEIIKDALELATGFSRQSALHQMEIDKLAEWQQDINQAIENKAESSKE